MKKAMNSRLDQVNNLLKSYGKLTVSDSGDLIIGNDNLNKLNEYKNMFGFLCLIKDERAIDVFSDCGFGGKSIYLNLKDNKCNQLELVNNYFLYKENNYRLKLDNGKVSWLDLWKAIDEIVKLNGNTEEFIISKFEVKESSNNRFYVKPVVEVEESDLD
jgi:hypothetical protein